MAFWNSGTTIGATVALVSIAAPAWSATITGTVVTADKEAKPIAGATVVVQSSAEWGKDFTVPVQTDASGRFSVTVPDGSEYMERRKQYGVPVYVFAPGYGVRQVSYKDGVPLLVALSPEQILRGTVHDEAGKPVADAPVIFHGMSVQAGALSFYVSVPPPLESFLSTKTDAAGKWQLGGVPTGPDLPESSGDVAGRKTHASLLLKDPRYVAVTLAARMEGKSPRKEIALVARVGGAITGRVLEGDKPVAGILVEAVNPKYVYVEDKQKDDNSGRSVTDANGVFRIPHLGDGTYIVGASAAKRELVAIAATGVVVKANAEVALPAPITLQSGALLMGKVVSKATGKPVKGVSVLARGTHAPKGTYGDFLPVDMTGEDGTFRLRVAPGDAQVEINSQSPGFVYFNPSLNVTVRSGETKTLAPIELPSALSVKLLVTDDAGKAVPDLPVRVTHAGWFDGQGWDQIPKTDANGEWDSTKDYRSLSADDKEAWVVRVPTGWEVVSPTELKLPTTTPIKVVVRKADLSSRSAGRAVSPDGKPVAEAQVSVSSYLKEGNGNQKDYQHENIVTGTDGRFVLPALRPNAVVSVRVSKWEHRTTKKGIATPTITIPADGKQPKLDDWVLTPLSGSVSGKMVGSTGKPIPGAWIWSYDGDTRAIARTDAKGVFTIKHVPATGTVGLAFAAGRSSGMYSATERANNVLRLVASVAKPALTPQARTAERRRQASRLIAEQAKEAEPGQGVRAGENDWDALADTVAAFDIPTALSLVRQKDGTIKEPHFGGVLVVATATNPDAAKVLFDKERRKWRDPWMVFFRSFDMGMAYATRDPAFATDCYETAKKEIGKGIPEDHAWSLLHLTKLAFRLRITDADSVFDRTVAAATKQFGDANTAKGEAIRFAAQGDGAVMAKRIVELPKEMRGDTATAIIEAMVDLQPLEAKKLLEGWIADGTIKAQSGYDQRNTYPRLAKNVAPFDGDGAAWIARQAPENSRWQA
ncbi:MAG: hypothetical protein H8F28_05870, partial [Fibrella sp.]|nr:hypothetical protein [Armatimonadota bacterium]